MNTANEKFTAVSRRGQTAGKSLFLFGALTVILTGCKIDFEAETVVQKDGSVSRLTRYIAADSKNEVETLYNLPAGGEWRREKVKDANAFTQKDTAREANIYEVKKSYRPGEAIGPDHVRKSEKSSAVARNFIDITTRDYVFVKFFDYQERFCDVTSKEQFEKALRKLYSVWSEEFAQQLIHGLGETVTLEKAKEAIKAEFDPLLSKLMTKFQAEGSRLLDDESFELELGTRLESNQVAGRLIKRLPPANPEEAAVWERTAALAFDNTNDIAADYAHETGLEQELYGVYGFNFFQTYEFKTSLALPGKVLTSNATRSDGTVLIWEFNHTDFTWEEHKLYARSRLLYPGRIILALGLAFFLGVSLIKNKRIKGKKKE